jgi:hypothetical protein
MSNTSAFQRFDKIVLSGGGGRKTLFCTRLGVPFRLGMLPDVAEVKRLALQPHEPASRTNAAAHPPVCSIHRLRLQPGTTIWQGCHCFPSNTVSRIDALFAGLATMTLQAVVEGGLCGRRQDLRRVRLSPYFFH